MDVTVHELLTLYENSQRCSYCGIDLLPDKVSFDHKTPLARGGTKTIENLAVSCFDCNYLKGVKTVPEFKMFVEEYCDRFRQAKATDDRAEGLTATVND